MFNNWLDASFYKSMVWLKLNKLFSILLLIVQTFEFWPCLLVERLSALHDLDSCNFGFSLLGHSHRPQNRRNFLPNSCGLGFMSVGICEICTCTDNWIWPNRFETFRICWCRCPDIPKKGRTHNSEPKESYPGLKLATFSRIWISPRSLLAFVCTIWRDTYNN